MKPFRRLLATTLTAWMLCASIVLLAPEVPGNQADAAPAPLPRREKTAPVPDLTGEWTWKYYGPEWHVKLSAGHRYEAVATWTAIRFAGTYKVEWKDGELRLTIEESRVPDGTESAPWDKLTNSMKARTIEEFSSPTGNLKMTRCYGPRS